MRLLIVVVIGCLLGFSDAKNLKGLSSMTRTKAPISQDKPNNSGMRNHMKQLHQQTFQVFAEDNVEIARASTLQVKLQNAVSPLHPYSFVQMSRYSETDCDGTNAEVSSVMAYTCLASATKSFYYTCDSKL